MKYEITGHTKLTGLLGSPVAHSISPMMHNEAFHILGLDYRYLAFDVDQTQLKNAVEGLRAIGVRGFNLTMPDKVLICDMLDELSLESQIAGSVNTVLNDGGKLIGYTTDGAGFSRALAEDGICVRGSKMTILGAGGAAVSIMVRAALEGAEEITVFNRASLHFKRAEKVMEKLQERTNCRLHIIDLSKEDCLKKEILESNILVNGTSVGMSPKEEGCLIPNPKFLHKDLYVFDAIYNPRETKLLKMAGENGCRTSNGLNMLLYQGAEAFKIWTGEEMPVEIIKEKYFNC